MFRFYNRILKAGIIIRQNTYLWRQLKPSNMRASVIKGILLSTIAVFIVSSCDKTNDDEPKNVFVLDPITDSIYPGKTKQFIDEFYADKTIICQSLCNPYLSNLDYEPHVLSGIKDGHLMFNVISKDGESISMEYISPDTISNPHSFSYYKGYGEWENQVLNLRNAYLTHYYELEDTTKIVVWHIYGINEQDISNQFNRIEFITGSDYKSVEVSDVGNVILGYNSIFFGKKCYSLKGEYLYDITSGYENIIIDTGISIVVFISEEEILYMSYYGSVVFFERTNLKTGNNVWNFYPSVQHNLQNPRTEFSITNIEGSTWEFICYAIGYDGTKIKLSAVIDIDNPGDFTMNEEVIE